MRTMVVRIGFAMMFAHAASGDDTDPALLEQQRLACLGDALRLCGDEMPYLEEVKNCMRGKKRLVSQACAAFYPPNAK